MLANLYSLPHHLFPSLLGMSHERMNMFLFLLSSESPVFTPPPITAISLLQLNLSKTIALALIPFLSLSLKFTSVRLLTPLLHSNCSFQSCTWGKHTCKKGVADAQVGVAGVRGERRMVKDTCSVNGCRVPKPEAHPQSLSCLTCWQYWA